MAKIRIGIVGTGGMATAHANHFKSIPGVELAACMDVVPDRAQAFADTHGVKHPLTELSDVLDACDAISIVTPDQYHVPILLDAFQADKHVLTEKPLALTLDEAKKAARAAVKATDRGLVHLINFSHRSPAFHKARRLVESGRLGELRYFRSAYLQHWITADSWGHWADREAALWRMSKGAGSGGALGDVGCHILDYITALTGTVHQLQCRFADFPVVDKRGESHTQYNGMKLDANMSALLTLELENGVIGSCDVTRVAAGWPNEVIAEIYGTEGGLRVSQGRWGQLLEGCLGKARHHNPPVWKAIHAPQTPNNWQAFIRGIKRGEPVQPDVVRGAEVQAYLDAAERSAANNGRYVSVKKWV